MTTVVAAAVDGVIVMAADTMTNIYDRPMPGSATKIRRVKVGAGELLLAFCGNGGLTNAADHVKIDAEPKPDDEDIRQWATAIVHAIDDWAREVGITDETGKLMDGSILLGWNGRLWTLSNAQAIPHLDGRAALGSGEGPALGALDVLLDKTKLPLGEAVTQACAVGISRDRFSGGPITMHLLPPTTDQAADAASPASGASRCEGGS